ncbi:MAG: methylase [Chlorobi bacterium]|nr:methylase [Chlorobiota bacterium]
MAKKRHSEFRAYIWIEAQLKLRDWNTDNPNSTPLGEVWTQGECLADPEIKKALGQARPENVVKVDSSTFWVIEAKEGKDSINKATQEAQEYAETINHTSNIVSAPLATGVAGNLSHGYEVQTFIRLNGAWRRVTVGAFPLTRFLSKEEARRLIAGNTSSLTRPELTVNEVTQLSIQINESLHKAKVEKERRALIVAFLLLALKEDPTLTLKGDPEIFISDINARAERVFKSSGKADLWKSVAIHTASDKAADVAGALSRIITLLKDADILHAVATTDILGSFFESFLRYGNTSKDLGIVFTPRHICWLGAEILAISPSDILFDLAAGTGGFLIAAFNRLRETLPIQEAGEFAAKNLFGVEASERVAALTFVNMYFRGDGKHNLKTDSCFNWNLVQVSHGKSEFQNTLGSNITTTPGATKILMNPPFALRDTDEVESRFVDHALAQLQDRALLFAVLPTSVMYERSDRDWRQRLLASNTLVAVMLFPTDLFYPVSTETLAIVVRKGIPHNMQTDVLWARIGDDGFIKRKGFRVEKSGVGYKKILEPVKNILSSWIALGVKGAPLQGEYEFATIRSDELIPQAHLGTPQLNQTQYLREARRVFREVTTQLWDQLEETGGGL